MTEKLTFTHPYGQNNTLNEWGDYDRLRVTVTRTNGAVAWKWELLSAPGRNAPERVLTDEQRRDVLEALFLMSAAREFVIE